MKIKSNKNYYAVKAHKSSQGYNKRSIIEYADKENAEKYFDNVYEIYSKLSVEEQSHITVFLVKLHGDDEEVLAYFGMGLSFFNGSPMWVSEAYVKGQ